MKRLVFCFDGTWNALNASTPTNVVLTAASIVRTTEKGVPQIIHYDEGVGTGRLEKLTGGMFGAGLVQNVREAYRFLIFNYDPGDEIFIFGFSRGGFSAQTFVGFIRHVGVLRRLHAERIDEALNLYRRRLGDDAGNADSMLRFRAQYADHVCVDTEEDAWRCANLTDYMPSAVPLLKIQYLGIWDAVCALGFPAAIPGSELLNRKHAFHDPKLTAFVEKARHAVAIDEDRTLFPPTLWDGLESLNAAKGREPHDPDAPYQQKWFPGVHGSVGGGGDIHGLSDCSLAWVLKGAKDAGLVLDLAQGSRIHGFNPDPYAPINNMNDPKWSFTQVLKTRRKGPTHFWEVSVPARRRWNAKPTSLPEGMAYRPKPLLRVAIPLDACGRELERPQGMEVLAQHVVVPGDYLQRIAKHYYGDAKKWQVIFEANRNVIDHPDEIFPGWVLVVPKIPDGGSASRSAPLAEHEGPIHLERD